MIRGIMDLYNLNNTLTEISDAEYQKLLKVYRNEVVLVQTLKKIVRTNFTKYPSGKTRYSKILQDIKLKAM